ncbi:MAG: hypothetical protein ACRYFX_11560 [Janthinobacterium lividum]
MLSTEAGTLTLTVSPGRKAALAAPGAVGVSVTVLAAVATVAVRRPRYWALKTRMVEAEAAAIGPPAPGSCAGRPAPAPPAPNSPAPRWVPGPGCHQAGPAARLTAQAAEGKCCSYV